MLKADDSVNSRSPPVAENFHMQYFCQENVCKENRGSVFKFTFSHEHVYIQKYTIQVYIHIYAVI